MGGRSIRLRVVAVLLGVVAAVALLEVLVRLARLAPLPAQVQDLVRDEIIRFRRQPGSVQRGMAESGEFRFEYAHNSLGFRDVEHATAKPADTLRIVGLGDSFTYGVGADFADTYLALVEQRLNQRADAARRVEIVKLGMPRHFPLLERRTLEDVGLRFAPDLVLVAVLPNDVIDTYIGDAALCVSDAGYLVSCDGLAWGGLPAAIARTSALARLTLRVAGGSGRRLWSMPPRSERSVDGGPYEAAWQQMEGELERMRAAAQAHGATLAVVAIPPSPRADPYPEARLRRWSAAHGALFISAYGAMQAADDPARPLYWAVDGHCTPAGYRVIADAIVAGLLAADQVP
ncbi:MAG: SGNH/GDSL hydrolase family protein [Candidatus Binatia bacterium]